MAVRDGLGKLKKSAPKIGASVDNLQRVIDTIYKDINDVVDAVNRPDSTSLSPGHKGKSGDIRLYQGAGQDGSIGYFLQGKFEEGWATVHLTLEEKNPDNVEVSDPESQSAGPEPFITKYGVNFSNLQVNSTIGEDADQVAYGNHQHTNHWGNAYQSGTHLNDIHFPLITSDTDTSSLLDDVNSNSGTSTSAARSDHSHRINTGHSFTWTADQTFGQSYGAAGKTVTINGPTTGNNQYALDVNGDVHIDGELLVSYGETQSNAVTLTGDVTMNSDNLSNNNYITYNNKTRIYGPTKFDAGVKISKQSINNNNAWHYDTTADDGKPPFIIENDAAEGQMRLQYDSNNYFDFKIDTSGNLLMDTVGNIQLRPTGNYVLPKGNLETHLGDIDRQWASIHAGELVVQNIMAMNIQSTIGGQLRVAPTSKLSASLVASTTDYIYLKHSDPNFQDAWIFLQKADLNTLSENVGDYSYIDGVVQFEAIRTKSTAPVSVGTTDEPSYRYEIETRNGDGVGLANSWDIDDAVVVLYKLATGGSKGFIELTSTGSVFNQYGPRITLFGAKEGDTAWNAAKPVIAIGNLRSYADYNATDDNNFGMILSNDATLSTIEMKGMTVDQNDGMRLFNTDLEMYDNGTKKVEILNDGRFRLGASLTLDNDGNWGAGDNVGLSWNGSQLVINGTVNITGGIYPDGSSVVDLPGTVNGLQQSIDAIDTSDMSDFAAAKQIINTLGDNIIQDWDMEFSPSADSTYNSMSFWGGANSYKDKSSTQVLQGSYSLKIAARHQSNVVPNGNQAHVDAFQTGLDGEYIEIPVVPGLKITSKFHYHSHWQEDGTPAVGMGRFSVKVYNAEKTYWTWVHIAKTDDNVIQDHLWRHTEGTFTFPASMSMQNASGDTALKRPAYVTPFLGTDTWGSASDTQLQNQLHWIYFDSVQMSFDTALAQPASPSGDAGFFAGSDLFGIHDGTNWRIQFAVDNQETSDVGNSYMALRDSSGNRQVSWDGDTFDIKGTLNVSGSSDDINLSDGNITLGDMGIIRSSSMTFGTNNNIGGFFLGVDAYGDSKFLVKNSSGDNDSSQQYIKVDTGATNTVEIKGALYADKLADVTPQIADAGGTYRPLTQVFTYFDGPQDRQDGNRVGDFSSTGPVLTDVRNGALVTVHIYAEGADDELHWINPRIIYSKYGHGEPARIPDVTSGSFLRNGFRLRDPWKEIDWVPYGGVTDGRQQSEPIWFKIQDMYRQNINGYSDTPVLEIASGSSGNLAGANINNTNLRENFFDTFDIITFAMEDQSITPSASQEFICKNLWSLNTVNDGDGTSYIRIPIGPESGSGYETIAYNGGSGDGPVPSASYLWTIWPCVSTASYDLDYRVWGYHDDINHDGKQAWDNLTYAEAEQMVVRPFNYQYYADTADSGFVPHFSHTYKFYIDIPDLHEGTHAGKVMLNFGTGIPWSAYRTFSEKGEIQQVTYNVTVDNAG